MRDGNIWRNKNIWNGPHTLSRFAYSDAMAYRVVLRHNTEVRQAIAFGERFEWHCRSFCKSVFPFHVSKIGKGSLGGGLLLRVD